MDLKSGYPFWAIKSGLMHTFPPLRDALRCEVAVVGGGITGAVIADALASRGFGVAVLEQRDVGWGSTAASTALLQYELDTHLVDLARRYGEEDAVRVYRACAEAIPRLRAVAASVRDVGFAMQDSLYLGSRRRDVRALRAECALRARHGFPVEWLDTGAVAERFAVTAPCAILSRLGARLDPYRMANRLLMRLTRRGGWSSIGRQSSRSRPPRGASPCAPRRESGCGAITWSWRPATWRSGGSHSGWPGTAAATPS